MVNKILKLCKDKGFFIDKYMLEFLNNLGDRGIEFVEKLINLGFNERIITQEVFNRYDLGDFNRKQDGLKILSNIDFSSKKIEINDFVLYFRDRYNRIKEILMKRNFEDLSSIRKIGNLSGVYTIIGMVYNKKITKNKNLLIEIEDLTGRSVVLVNNENKKLFSEAENLLLDDVVAFRVSGSSKMLFVSEIIYPDASLKVEKFSDVDEYIAFGGSFHVGSKTFLEKNVLKFVSWLNGEVGDARQRSIAHNIKYLVLAGDNIDGVGVYPDQEKFLSIKSCYGQYKRLGEILGKIRPDIQIIMCPGQHDAVWIGEPQPKISEKWSSNLYKMKNLHMISNPCMIEIEGIKVLIYYGMSINNFINGISEIRLKFKHNSSIGTIKEMLKRRHLAPIYGTVDIVINKEKDNLIVDSVPDIIVVGSQCCAQIGSYNNILMISSSSWQPNSSFNERVGSSVDPCKVPLFNLKTRETKIVDFSNVEVKDV